MLVTFNALARGSKNDNLTKRGMRLNLKRVAANNVYVNCAPSLKALRAPSLEYWWLGFIIGLKLHLNAESLMRLANFANEVR